MTLDDWTETTKRIVAKSPGEPFVPILADPATRTIRALEGVPSDVSATEALQDWIGELGIEEFFFAISENLRTIIVGHCTPNGGSFARLDEQDGAWKVTAGGTPTWWRL